jgi:hypothetical protein
MNRFLKLVATRQSKPSMVAHDPDPECLGRSEPGLPRFGLCRDYLRKSSGRSKAMRGKT